MTGHSELNAQAGRASPGVSAFEPNKWWGSCMLQMGASDQSQGDRDQSTRAFDGLVLVF